MAFDVASGDGSSFLSPGFFLAVGLVCVAVSVFFVVRSLILMSKISSEQERLPATIEEHKRKMSQCLSHISETQKSIAQLASAMEDIVGDQMESLRLIGVLVTSVRVNSQTWGNRTEEAQHEDPIDQAVRMMHENHSVEEIIEKTGLDLQTVNTLSRIQKQKNVN